MNKQLFRMEVIDAGRERLAGTVVAAVPPSSRLYTGLLLGVAAIIVAILIFGSYATSARVRGIVAYDTGTRCAAWLLTSATRRRRRRPRHPPRSGRFTFATGK